MKIASGMREELKKFGTENIRALLFPGYSTPAGLSPTLAKIRQQSLEREAALEWLSKKDRAAEAHEERPSLLEFAAKSLV